LDQILFYIYQIFVRTFLFKVLKGNFQVISLKVKFIVILLFYLIFLFAVVMIGFIRRIKFL